MDNPIWVQVRSRGQPLLAVGAWLRSAGFDLAEAIDPSQSGHEKTHHPTYLGQGLKSRPDGWDTQRGLSRCDVSWAAYDFSLSRQLEVTLTSRQPGCDESDPT